MRDALLPDIASDILEQEPESITTEILTSRIRSFGKECFPDFSEENRSYPNFINRATILNSFGIDGAYKKDLIIAEAGSVFWLSDLAIPFFAHCTSNAKKSFLTDEGQKEVKELFKKWITTEQQKEKTYFGLSLLNFIKRNYNEDSIISLIISAVIFIYDPKLRSFDKTNFLLERVESYINDNFKDENLRNELLEPIYIFKGINFLFENRLEESINSFEATLSVNPYSPTGLFYSSLIHTKTDNISLALENISSLLNYDLRRIELALQINNLPLLEFFAKNSILANLFFEDTFAEIYNDIKGIISSSSVGHIGSINEISALLENISKLNLEEYIDESSQNEISFLYNYTLLSKNYQNVLLHILKEKIFAKSKNVVEKISVNIKEAQIKLVNDDLKIYDNQITDAIKKVDHFEKEIDAIKNSSSENLKLAIVELERSIKQQITSLENKIHEIEESRESNAYSGFNNNMVLNVIISMVVFIIGGFVNGIGETASQTYNYAELMQSIFSNGLKWSGIVFILGLIISIIGFIANLIETFQKKQRLMRKISSISGRKDTEIAKIKTDFETREKNKVDAFQRKITEMQRAIDGLKEEKERRRAILEVEFHKSVEPTIKQLEELVTGF